MPIIQVHLLEGRTDKQLKKLIGNLTEAAMYSLDVKADQVRVVIHPVSKKYWSVGGVTKAELENKE